MQTLEAMRPVYMQLLMVYYTSNRLAPAAAAIMSRAARGTGADDLGPGRRGEQMFVAGRRVSTSVTQNPKLCNTQNSAQIGRFEK